MWWQGVPDELPGEHRRRQPATLLAIAASVGIALDSAFAWPLSTWFVLAVIGVLLWRQTASRVPRAETWLLASVIAAFGAWHHLWWTERPANAIARIATETAQPVALAGRVIQSSWTQSRDDGQPVAFAVLRCESLLREGRSTQIVSGLVRMSIERSDLRLAAGSNVEVLGRLELPATAGNPGTFDFRNWLRRQGIDALVRVDSADAVTLRPFQPTLWERWLNQRHQLRSEIVTALTARLPSVPARVTEALLLGARTQLPDEVCTAFVESGTLHILAISGVNVGVVWWMLLTLCRAIGLPHRTSAVTVMACLIGYAWLTDANPPVVRAVTFAVLMQAAEFVGRAISPGQALSLAALWLLAGNPCDLFDPGAQLSFLSVAVLVRTTRWPVLISADHAASGWFSALGQLALRASIATMAIWLVTTPLVAARFHLISPAGLVLNVFLGPVFLVLLWLGYFWLLALAVMPLVASLVLWPFGHLLGWLLDLTRRASDWHLGHLYVPDIPLWWLIGFYALVAITLAVHGRAVWDVGVRGLLLWTNLGLVIGFIPSPRVELTCDVLSVGHGLAVVTKTPGGRTLVYDCGSLIGPNVAAEAVGTTLWSHGLGRADLLVLSHADADHCNGAALLAERVVPGTLLAHRSLVQRAPPVVMTALDAWVARGGYVRLVAQGDRVELEPGVMLDVRHPAHDFRGERDNANSLVLELTFAERRILLTGDLERDGLAELLSQPRRPVDVLLAPHHGSRTANSSTLARWTNPAAVAISTNDRAAHERLTDVFPEETLLLNTAVTGRQRIRIGMEGALGYEVFRASERK